MNNENTTEEREPLEAVVTVLLDTDEKRIIKTSRTDRDVDNSTIKTINAYQEDNGIGEMVTKFRVEETPTTDFVGKREALIKQLAQIQSQIDEVDQVIALLTGSIGDLRSEEEVKVEDIK